MESAEELKNQLVKIVMDNASRSLYDRKYIIKTLIPHLKFMKKFVENSLRCYVKHRNLQIK